MIKWQVLDLIKPIPQRAQHHAPTVVAVDVNCAEEKVTMFPTLKNRNIPAQSERLKPGLQDSAKQYFTTDE